MCGRCASWVVSRVEGAMLQGELSVILIHRLHKLLFAQTVLMSTFPLHIILILLNQSHLTGQGAPGLLQGRRRRGRGHDDGLRGRRAAGGRRRQGGCKGVSLMVVVWSVNYALFSFRWLVE